MSDSSGEDDEDTGGTGVACSGQSPSLLEFAADKAALFRWSSRRRQRAVRMSIDSVCDFISWSSSLTFSLAKSLSTFRFSFSKSSGDVAREGLAFTGLVGFFCFGGSKDCWQSDCGAEEAGLARVMEGEREVVGSVEEEEKVIVGYDKTSELLQFNVGMKGRAPAFRSSCDDVCGAGTTGVITEEVVDKGAEHGEGVVSWQGE